MRLLVPLVVGFLVYLAYGLFMSQYDIRIIRTELNPRDPEGFHDYSGVINVHSKLSTGSGSIEDIIADAQASALDFIMITDVNPTTKPLEWEGYHNQLLVFVDGEYSYLNSRLLNLDSSRSDLLSGAGRSQVVIADLLSQKDRNRNSGLFILTRPTASKTRWTGEYPAGLDGIEVINLKAMWQRAWLESKVSFFWSLLIYPFNDRLSLLRLFEEPKKELALWDELAKQRPILGIAGSDAEARVRIDESRYIKFPSYRTSFGLVRNHVLLKSELTGQSESDRGKIAQALRDGHFYLSLDTLANPVGFLAQVIDKDGHRSIMGSTVRWSSGLELSVSLPHKPEVPFDILIYKDGQRFATSNSQSSRFSIHEAGVYRVAVRVIPTFPLPDGKKWVPWIYTNPFYVRK